MGWGNYLTLPSVHGERMPTDEYDLWVESLETCPECGAEYPEEDMTAVDYHDCEELLCYACSEHFEVMT
ncbi:hypothetical protein GZL_01366 [Streptomyces sp. 769]|nr:hypothetical protein GZL_01366 [Streptomyces sp. 769]